MTAPVGTKAFASKTSKSFEYGMVNFIEVIYNKYFDKNKWSYCYNKLGQKNPLTAMSISNIVNNNCLAYKKNGESSKVVFDFIFYYDNKPAIIGSIKFQYSRQNAVERVLRDLELTRCLGLPESNFIAIFGGLGFLLNENRHIQQSTGSLIEILRDVGVPILIHSGNNKWRSDIESAILNAKLKIENKYQ